MDLHVHLENHPKMHFVTSKGAAALLIVPSGWVWAEICHLTINTIPVIKSAVTLTTLTFLILCTFLQRK